jgi:GNAT superfamily N-acetyltransferase
LQTNKEEIQPAYREPIMIWKRDQYVLTDDQSNIELDFVVASLNTTYWAAERPREIIEASVKNSVLLSLFLEKRQIGFTRIVSDFATVSYICDVYINPIDRKKGLGKWMVECALEHPSTAFGTQLLATKDAHGLYEKYGFVRAELMRRVTKTSTHS